MVLAVRSGRQCLRLRQGKRRVKLRKARIDHRCCIVLCSLFTKFKRRLWASYCDAAVVLHSLFALLIIRLPLFLLRLLATSIFSGRCSTDCLKPKSAFHCHVIAQRSPEIQRSLCGITAPLNGFLPMDDVAHSGTSSVL